ncbi:MAG: transcriptional regulator [Bacteroidetes bacterium]|nr:MAG: transcriptional regulator [Bacteroidota bacterium]
MKNRLKIERAIHGLTQSELADKVQVSRQTIHSIEQGKYNPSIILALKICEVMEKTIEEVFELERSDWDSTK